MDISFNLGSLGNFLTSRSHSAGQFEFAIDGSDAFYVKSFEGGLPKGNTVEEQIGTSQYVVKHLSTFEIEPMTIEMGMQDALPTIQWIRQSWKRQFCRKNGTIKLADFNMNSCWEYQFTDALIAETTLPGLDAAGKDSATLKLKIQPERAELDQTSDGLSLRPQGLGYPKQKQWNVSCFGMELKGFDTTKVSKIESFTVKQAMKSYNSGRERFAFWEPTKLTFPDLSVHLSLTYADDIIQWYKDTVLQGGTDPSLQTTGVIRYLDPSKRNEVFEIDLYGVGIKGITIDKAERGDSARRVKFDLYVSEMDIQASEFSLGGLGGGGGGLSISGSVGGGGFSAGGSVSL